MATADPRLALGSIPGLPDYGYTDDFTIIRLTPKRGTFIGRVSKWCVSSDGYAICNLRAPDGRLITVGRASLVCRHFHGDRPKGMLVLHGDGDPLNDKPENLRWGSYSDNIADMIRHGRGGRACGDRHGSRTSPNSTPRGESHPSAKLTANQVRRIRAEPGRYADIAAPYGVTGAMVGRIKRGISWKSLP